MLLRLFFNTVIHKYRAIRNDVLKRPRFATTFSSYPPWPLGTHPGGLDICAFSGEPYMTIITIRKCSFPKRLHAIIFLIEKGERERERDEGRKGIWETEKRSER
jgi:hypothetical protein